MLAEPLGGLVAMGLVGPTRLRLKRHFARCCTHSRGPLHCRHRVSHTTWPRDFLPISPFTEAVLPVPGHAHSYVLSLNDQIFTFANLIGKAWAQILPLVEEHGAQRLDLDREGWMAALTLESPGVQRFIDAMLAAKGGRPSRAQQYWPRPEWVDLAVFIRDAMEYFLVGRGLAHVVLGHVRTAPVRSLPILGRPVRIFESSVEQDAAANLSSMQWVLAAERFRDGPPLAGWSIILWNYCMLEP